MAGTHKVTADRLVISHCVLPGENGKRLDQYLKEYYRRKSREEIKRQIHAGSITVIRDHSPHLMLGGKLKPSSQLFTGDQVHIFRARKPEPPVNWDYKVLYEDDWLFIIEKPAPLPLHPAGRYYFHTLLVHLRTQGFTRPLEANHEYYLVHRIDKETSGVLVLAKNAEACAHVVKQFADRKTIKTYLAIVKGRVEQEEFTVDAAMNRDPHAKVKLKMSLIPESEGGQHASTQFRRLEVRGDYSLVECRPKTGRQHQIRLHLDSVGHPIVGDKLYGISEENALKLFERPQEKDTDTKPYLSPEMEALLILPRHALHAWAIEFVHPFTEKKLRFESPLPEDLRGFFEKQK